MSLSRSAVHVLPVGVLVTVYLVMAMLPGVGVGAIQLTVALATPGMATGVPGAPGIVAGTRCTGADGGPVPAALVAVTLKAYVTPFVSPMIVHVSAPDVEHVFAVLVTVTLYPVI